MVLTQIAARIGVSLGTLVLGTTVVATVLVAGGIYWATRDSGTTTNDASPAGEPYGVFLVDDDVMVGQEAKIAATNACDLLGWGLECSPIGPGGAEHWMQNGPGCG